MTTSAPKGGSRLDTFYDSLPAAVREAAGRRAAEMNRGLGGGGSTNSINWRTGP